MDGEKRNALDAAPVHYKDTGRGNAAVLTKMFKISRNSRRRMLVDSRVFYPDPGGAGHSRFV